MENEQGILIWKYLDGECSPQEKEEFQRLLSTDVAFAGEFALAQSLQENLQQLEPEEPSMRFSANVADQLPTLYRPVHASPDLLPKGLVRIFSALVGSIALLSLGLFFGGQQQNVPSQFNILGWYTLNLGLFSNPMVFAAFLGSLAILSYFLMDFTLKKWILKK